MSERRTEDRKKVMAFTLVRDQRQGALIGYLGNLTLRGALLIGEKPLAVNEHVPLEMEFPSAPTEAHAPRLLLEARVVRCVSDPENPREFNIGVEFLQVNEAQTQLIQSLLERYHFRYQEGANLL
ncbi:MAG: PilZ domain-containing protein [Anaerolineales bacterium]|nr:PilZ domain-containing protein [Anaerolineales bacterium]MCX7756565.1 PilZ domain-containing protein [Anaerolineales bacterium]